MKEHRLIFLGTLAMTAMLAVAGCGGGGGGGSDPVVTPPPVTPPPDGGIDRGGVAVGPIDGFGSVIVNGVRFDTSDAALRQRVLKEEEPYECIECGKPFGVASTIERIVAQLEAMEALEDTLRRAGQLVWGGDRPPTLIIVGEVVQLQEKLSWYQAPAEPKTGATSEIE